MAGVLGALALFLLLPSSVSAQEEPGRRDSTASDEWLAPDKAAHVFGGFWSAAAGYAAAGSLGADRGGRRAAAVTAGVTAGLAKEMFDHWAQRERFSWKDLAADAVGIALLLALTAAAEP